MEARTTRIVLKYQLVINCYLLWRHRKKKSTKRTRQWWVHPVNQLRLQQGDFCHLFQELKEDPCLFFKYTRMSVELFYKVLNMVSPQLTRRNWRALTPEHRLAITLRYLATGDQTSSVVFAYRVGESTVLEVVKEICDILLKVLAPVYLKTPTKNEWQEISKGFWQHWNFPNCVGALDGKRILIQAPPNSGSLFFNYKKHFSIVLMAVCDFEYKFTLVDIGAYGSDNDAGVFSKSTFGQAVRHNLLDIPSEPVPLPSSQMSTPLSFIGDDAFPLKDNIMKPYLGKNLERKKLIFNYRLSRARRTIENTFGILSSRWRILHRPISLHPKNVDKIVMAEVCLHNFLMHKNNRQNFSERLYCPPNFVDHEDAFGELIHGTWTQGSVMNGVTNLKKSTAHRALRSAYSHRDTFTEYFLTPCGEVPWQYDYIRRGENR